MPEIMQKISLFMPQRWAMMAIETFQKEEASADIILNIVIMIAFAAAFFAIAAYRMTVRRHQKIRIKDDGSSSEKDKGAVLLSMMNKL